MTNTLQSAADGVTIANPTRILPAGSRLHEFELLSLIGEGGFGIVYLALDHSLERHVALKEYLPSELAARSSDKMVAVRSQREAELFSLGLKSFVNEARLLARFDPRALVKVYRFWEANGTAYMAMPYYEGPTLKKELNGKPAPDEAWLRSRLEPLLDALRVLHDAQCSIATLRPTTSSLPHRDLYCWTSGRLAESSRILRRC